MNYQSVSQWREFTPNLLKLNSNKLNSSKMYVCKWVRPLRHANTIARCIIYGCTAHSSSTYNTRTHTHSPSSRHIQFSLNDILISIYNIFKRENYFIYKITERATFKLLKHCRVLFQLQNPFRPSETTRKCYIKTVNSKCTIGNQLMAAITLNEMYRHTARTVAYSARPSSVQ